MALTDLTQAERLELRTFNRVYLVQLAIGGSKTLYFSDRNYYYAPDTQDYENYLFDLSDLDTTLERLRSGTNTKLTLRFRNEAFEDNSYLIELHDTNKFTYGTCYIYELRLVEDDEQFGSDIKTLVYRGSLGQPYGITRTEFKVDCQAVLSSKKDRLPLEVIDTDTYANADPDDLGKYRNIIYGYVDNVVCRSVIAGAVDVLKEDLTDSQTTITVSGDTKITFPSSGTIQIEQEQITYTGFSSNQFTGCTRGANGTDAVVHDKGQRAFQVLSEYWYEISQHPLTSIDAVRVDGIRITDDITTYTNSGGKGMIKFTVKPIIEKQVALDHTDTVSDTIDVSDTITVNDGIGVTDNISFSSSNSTMEIYPNSHNHSGVTNPSNAYDGSQDTYAGFSSGSNWIWLYFPSTDYGTISTQYAYNVIRYGTWTLTSNSGSWSPSSLSTSGAPNNFATVRSSKSGGSWNDQIRMTPDGSARLYEAWKVVHYEPDLTKTGSASKTGSATKGGSASKTGSATGAGTLTGNSSADVVIGQTVTCDCTGYNITDPDAIIWDILETHLGESSTYKGTPFSLSGTMGFVLHEVATDADKLIQRIAYEARGKFVEWNGKFYCIDLSGAAPAVTYTFTEDDLLEEPEFGFTKEVAVKNYIQTKYKRDYRQFGSGAYDKTVTDEDATSQSDYGQRNDTVELKCVRDNTTASNFGDWYITEKHDVWKTVKVVVPWIGKQFDPNDTFSLTWDFNTGITWDIVSYDIDRQNEKVTIYGQQWPS